MKKLRFLLLAAIVLATLVVFSLSANAAVIASGNCGENGDNVKWTLDDTGTLTVYGTGKIKGTDWAYEYAFFDRDTADKVKHVIIKEGVTEIGIGSFACFGSLESVTMADSVIKIGEAAFYWSHNLKNIYWSKNITEIPPHAFCGNNAIENLELPSGIKSIGAGAFCGSGLRSVVIPEGVTTIDYGAFAYCDELESVHLPESLITIEYAAFFKCDKLANIYLPSGLEFIGDGAIEPKTQISSSGLVVVDGVTFSKDMKTLVKYSSAKAEKSYTVPDSVETILSYAFYDCTNLTTLNLNDGLIRICANAFDGCTNIKELVLPASVKMDSAYSVRADLGFPRNYINGMGGYGEIFYPFAGMQLDTLYVCGMETDVLVWQFEAFLPAKNVYILRDSATDTSTKEVFEHHYKYYNKDPDFLVYGNLGAFATIHYFTPHTHSYTSNITKSPTCTSTGTKKFTCSCGDAYTETIAKAEHTCDKWFVLVPPKAGIEGRECGLCNVCGAVAIRSIAALPKDRPVFRLTSTETENGYAVTLSLENNVNGFYSLGVVVKYDSAKLKCVNADTSNAVAKFEAASTSDSVFVNYADTAFFASKGELCTMYFEATEENPTGSTEVAITTVISENPYTAVNCTIDLEKETAPETTTVIMTIGQAAGFVSGKAFALDAAPIIRNDRTMLPVRFVAEAFGAEVGWDGATSTATVKTEDTEIAITIGANTATVNGEEVTLDSPAFIENSRTYLPVRFVAEKLGATVEWNGASSTATLTK